MALGGAIHCDKLLFQDELAPNNDCDQHACNTFVQDGPAPYCDELGGYCRVNTSFTYDLLVSVPSGAPHGPSLTFFMTSEDLKVSIENPSCLPGSKCVAFPAFGSSNGIYKVDPETASRVGRNLGNPSFTSLPVATVFYPLAPGPTTALMATDLGYPLLPRLAGPLPAGTPTNPPLPPGPSGGAPTPWEIALAAGRYLRVTTPNPPFNDSFPPREDIVDIQSPEYEEVPLTTQQLKKREFVIGPDVDSRDLTGFTAVLQDSIAHRDISNVVTLGKGTKSVTLFLANREVLQDVPVELVVAPPAALAREGVPSLIAAANPIIAPRQTYPVIKPAVDFSGTVTGPVDDPGPVRATAVIRSIEGALPSNANVLLRHAVTISTDDNGVFATKLPPGRYDAAIFPEYSYGLAPWVDELNISEGGAIHRTFSLARPATMRGSVKLTNGAPLADAEVEAHAAAEPGNLPPGARPPLPFPPFSRAMHTVLTRTDAEGAFSFPLDPGYYDIVVRPREGTRFPWLVTTGRKMEREGVTLPLMVVPVPMAVSVTLIARPFPVPGALVRVFAIPKGKNMAVEIGRTVSSETGSVELFLAGLPN